MPDPDRFVRRSLAFLRRLGLAEQPALDVIIIVAGRTHALASEHSPQFRGWLEQVRRCAAGRQGSPAGTTPDQEGTHHANG